MPAVVALAPVLAEAVVERLAVTLLAEVVRVRIHAQEAHERVQLSDAVLEGRPAERPLELGLDREDCLGRAAPTVLDAVRLRARKRELMTGLNPETEATCKELPGLDSNHCYGYKVYEIGFTRREFEIHPMGCCHSAASRQKHRKIRQNERAFNKQRLSLSSTTATGAEQKEENENLYRYANVLNQRIASRTQKPLVQTQIGKRTRKNDQKKAQLPTSSSMIRAHCTECSAEKPDFSALAAGPSSTASIAASTAVARFVDVTRPKRTPRLPPRPKGMPFPLVVGSSSSGGGSGTDFLPFPEGLEGLEVAALPLSFALGSSSNSKGSSRGDLPLVAAADVCKHESLTIDRSLDLVASFLKRSKTIQSNLKQVSNSVKRS